MAFHRSSQFETLKVLLVLLLFLAAPQSFSAPRCEDLFKPGFVTRIMNWLPFAKKADLSEAQINELKGILEDTRFERPYGMARDEKDPMFTYLWLQMSVSQRQVLTEIIEAAPKEFKKFYSSITSALESKNLEIKHQHFVNYLLLAWGQQLRDGKASSFSDWMMDLETKLQSEDADKLKARYKTGQEMTLADQNWKSLGVKALEMKASQVRVGDVWLKCKISADSIRILVPREMVKHAAWNPLSTEVLIQKMQSNAPKLSVFPGFLGADAKFYLSDGNHRFAVDTRPEVWIEMSFPAKSSSFSISFDAMGIPQPSLEQKLQLLKNEITLQDILGPLNYRRFYYHE